MAAKANYPKPPGLKQQKSVLSPFGIQKSEGQVWAGSTPPAGSRRGQFFPGTASGLCLQPSHPLACGCITPAHGCCLLPVSSHHFPLCMTVSVSKYPFSVRVSPSYQARACTNDLFDLDTSVKSLSPSKGPS